MPVGYGGCDFSPFAANPFELNIKTDNSAWPTLDTEIIISLKIHYFAMKIQNNNIIA